MKSFWTALAFFVMFTGSIVAYGEFALAMSGMGGMYDKYDGTWIETAIRWSFPIAAIYWIVAALLNLVLAFLCVWKRTKPSVFLAVGSFMNLAAFLLLDMSTSNSVSRFVDAFVDVLFG